MKRIVLLAAIFFALPARAADVKLEVTGTPVKAEVPLGQDIEIEVKVKNSGAADVELPELTFDARSVSFEVATEGGKAAWDTQFHVDAGKSSLERYPLTPLKRSKLKAGEEWKKTFTIPAIASGAWTVTAMYAGATDPEPRTLEVLHDPNRLNRVKDAPKTVKVLPGPNGETYILAKLSTTLGTIALRFFHKEALGSALNFVRIVQSGYYDGKRFFRIDRSLDIIQGGSENGGAHFGWTIPREQFHKHDPLAVSYARSMDPNSAGAQFFICTGPLAAALDRPDGYAVFAHIVKGRDVVDALYSVKTKGDPNQMGPGQEPATPLSIESAKIQLAPKE